MSQYSSSSRLAAAFARLGLVPPLAVSGQGSAQSPNPTHGTARKALIPYLMAGDPTPEATVAIMHAAVRGGANIIELGVPFSDPMADGPVIQAAAERALKHRVGLRDVLDMVAEFRQTDAQTPVVLMGYANPVERMGAARFAADAQRAGVDGVLIVDYPPEEAVEFSQLLSQHHIDPIFLIAPTTTQRRIASVAAIAKGYVYYVSLKGVTGAGHIDTADVAQRLAAVRQHVRLPIGVGFGIRDADSAVAVARVADAVVIGSRLVQAIQDGVRDVDQAGQVEAAARATTEWLSGIRKALDSIAADVSAQT